MKKLLLIGVLIGGGLSIFPSCDKEDVIIDGPDIENPDPENPADEITDLSADEMANCYVALTPGLYKFKADNQFNLGDGLPVPPQIFPDSAALVWQTEQGLIKSVELVKEADKPYIVFEKAEGIGNALIAVFDSSGEIAWSWHIWMPVQPLISMPIDSGYEISALNLGAIDNIPGDPLSYGMLYQWGRKDPFPASATATGDTSTVSAPLYDMDGNSILISNSPWTSVADNTIEYSISHPTVCLSNYAQYSTSRDWLAAVYSDDSLWGNPEGDYRDSEANLYPNKGRKTCYDPCPPGWRVGPVDVFRNFTSTGGYAWTFDDFNVADVNNDGVIDLNDYDYGWHFRLNEKTSSYFPAASRFDGSYAMLMGSVAGYWGNYWSNSPGSSMAGGAFCALSFQVKDQAGNEMTTASASAAGSRADAYSIRPIKDE